MKLLIATPPVVLVHPETGASIAHPDGTRELPWSRFWRLVFRDRRFAKLEALPLLELRKRVLSMEAGDACRLSDAEHEVLTDVAKHPPLPLDLLYCPGAEEMLRAVIEAEDA